MVRTAFAIMSAILPLSAFSQEYIYKGMCEASAGVLLGEGRFAAVSDETNNMEPEKDILHTYTIGVAEPILFLLPVQASDIEAATRIGTSAYFLTSHSWNGENKDRPKRKHLFALDLESLEASKAQWDITGLREMIAPAIEVKTGIVASDLPARLNIEGLAATSNGHLLVGLREPLKPAASPIERQALVIDIGNASNFGQEQPDELQASAIRFVNLGGRGIRSIEQVGEQFLIVAGVVHGPDDRFRSDFGQYETTLDTMLFWWDGHSEDVLPVNSQVDFDVFGSAHPEGLIFLDNKKALILGDNGRSDSENYPLCSDEVDPVEKRSFPTLTVSF